MEENQKSDYRKFFVEKGEPNFSPERNQFIIDSTIKKYEATRRQKALDYREQVAERSDAVITYLRSLKSGMTVEKYFGRRTLAYLQGRKIMAKIKGKMTLLSSLD